jgi:hypothetical protein
MGYNHGMMKNGQTETLTYRTAEGVLLINTGRRIEQIQPDGSYGLATSGSPVYIARWWTRLTREA